MLAASRGSFHVGGASNHSLVQTSADPLDLTALFPKDAYGDGIENCPEVIEAQEELAARAERGMPSGSVEVVEDGGLPDQVVVEIVGPGASLAFQSRAAIQPLLVAYVKVSDTFFSLRVNVVPPPGRGLAKKP